MSYDLAFKIAGVIAAITFFTFIWLTHIISKVRAAANHKPPRLREGSTVAHVLAEAKKFEDNKWKIVKGGVMLILGTFLLTLLK